MVKSDDQNESNVSHGSTPNPSPNVSHGSTPNPTPNHQHRPPPDITEGTRPDTALSQHTVSDVKVQGL